MSIIVSLASKLQLGNVFVITDNNAIKSTGLLSIIMQTLSKGKFADSKIFFFMYVEYKFKINQ